MASGEGGNEDSELLESLSPKEAAVYRFLQRLETIEQTAKQRGERVEVVWNNGLGTKDLLDAIKRGDRDDFPVPKGDEYPAFSWFITRNEITRGSYDIRIFDFKEKSLKFMANMGSIGDMDTDIKSMFDGEPYPVIVEDRSGYKYKNRSFVNAAIPDW